MCGVTDAQRANGPPLTGDLVPTRFSYPRGQFQLQLRIAALLSLICVTSSACGPFGYISRVSKPSRQAQQAALEQQAEELAPYEYWAGVAYLEQSRQLMGYSEYERAFDYGNRAEQLFESARQKAMIVKQSAPKAQPAVDGENISNPVAPGVTPEGR